MLTTATLMLGLALTSDADAAGFEPKTMRDPLSAREVERGLTLAKGWLEFGFGADVKVATGYWDSEGVAQDFDSAEFLYTTEKLALRYGFTRRSEMFWTIPFHYIKLTNAPLGTETAQFGLGDPVFGFKFEVFHSMAPATSVIVYAAYKAPAGNEAPGNYIGGPNTFTSFVMSTGTPDLEVGARGKRQVGPLAVTAGVGYVHRFSNVVQYAIETKQNQFASRLKPGDIVKGDAELLFQVGPVALKGGALVQMRDATRIGSTSKGFFGVSSNLDPITDSDGWSLDAGGGAVFNITRGVDLDLAVSYPVRGEDLQFFPIEELSPTRGTTYSGALELRY